MHNLRLYKISKEDILKAIELPDISNKEGNKIIAIKNFQNKFSGHPLKVVYRKIEKEILVITVYPLKKKLWR